MQKIIVGAPDAGQRLDKFLQKYLKEAEKGFLYKMLRKKNITLNKKKADGSEKLAAGDELCFFFSPETFEKFRGQHAAAARDDERAHKRVDRADDKLVVREREVRHLPDEGFGV